MAFPGPTQIDDVVSAQTFASRPNQNAWSKRHHPRSNRCAVDILLQKREQRRDTIIPDRQLAITRPNTGAADARLEYRTTMLHVSAWLLACAKSNNPSLLKCAKSNDPSLLTCAKSNDPSKVSLPPPKFDTTIRIVHVPFWQQKLQ